MTAEESGLGHRIAKGAVWMILQRMAVRIIGLTSTIVLARLLLPADFGIIALATGMFVVVDSLMEMGFDLALIQNQTDGRKRYNTAWTLSIIRGLLTAAILLIAAQPIATLYDDQRLIAVTAWLAVLSVINGLQNIGIVEFRKDLRFDREFHLLVGSKVVGFVVTLTLAWVWRDYRALIAGIVAGRVAAVALSYIMHSYRPSLSLAGGLGFLHISTWLCLNNILMIIKTRLDTFVVGKIAGTEALGFYNVGYEISNLTSTELIAPISRVLIPGFSKLGGDRLRLARSYIDTLAALAFLAVPVAVGIALTAEHIVGIFLGARWLSIVPLIQILTLYGLLNLTSSNSMSLYLALGRPHLIAILNLPSVLVLIPGVILATRSYGTEGAAWALVFSAAVNFVANFWMVRRALDIGMGVTTRAIWRPICGAAIMFVVVALIERSWPTADNVIQLVPQLGVLAACGAVVYFAAVFAMWHLAGRPVGTEQRLLLLFKAYLDARAVRALKAAPDLERNAS